MTMILPAAPTCCRCDQAVCNSDPTGDTCEGAGCATCINGCPAIPQANCCTADALYCQWLNHQPGADADAMRGLTAPISEENGG